MAKVYFIATLMILQGFFFLYGEATTTLTVSPSVTEGSTAVTTGEATPTVGGTVTTAMGGGTVTTAMGGGTVTTAMGGGTDTTVMSGGTVTTAMGGGTDTTAMSEGTVTTGMGGGTVTTAMSGGTVTTAMGEGTVTTAMGGGGGGGTVTTAAGGGGGGATVTTAMGGGGGGGTVTTAAAGGGGGATITTVAGGGGGGATVTAVAVTTAMGGGGGGGTVTTAAGGGGISPTTTIKTIPVSSVGVENKKPGPKVSLNLIVTTDCSGDKLKDLNVSLQNDIKVVYADAKFPIKTVITRSTGCNSLLNITLDLSFYSGLPSGTTIKKVFQDALKKGNISSLTESNTKYTFTFVGVELKYSPKEGECQNVCCDGGGGELTVVLKCTPADNTCEGIENDEKKEDGHCPGDSLGTCPDTCDEDDSGSHHNTPSFAVIILLVLTKTIFC